MLSILSKPLERHIHKHMYSYLTGNNILHSSQSGFRSAHSCHTALIKMCDQWHTAINESNIVGTVFLDLQKAFDLVNHELLMKKLALYFTDSITLPFFQSYLSDRKQQVYLGNKHSSEGLVRFSVPIPQGSVLGPLLFCLFINDLPLNVTDKSVVCDMFADDSTIYTSHKEIQSLEIKLQHSLKEIKEWCIGNDMILHPKKTKSMIITTRQKHQIQPLKVDLILNETSIEQVHTHRHLGITIDEELNWHAHINTLNKIISRNLYLLSQLKQYANLHSLKLFYHAHIASHLTYASTLWDNCSNNVLKQLNSLHRRAAKVMITDPSLTTDDKLKKK